MIEHRTDSPLPTGPVGCGNASCSGCPTCDPDWDVNDDHNEAMMDRIERTHAELRTEPAQPQAQEIAVEMVDKPGCPGCGDTGVCLDSGSCAGKCCWCGRIWGEKNGEAKTEAEDAAPLGQEHEIDYSTRRSVGDHDARGTERVPTSESSNASTPSASRDGLAQCRERALPCGHPEFDRLENDGCATCALHDAIAWRDEEIAKLEKVVEAAQLVMKTWDIGHPLMLPIGKDLRQALAALSSPVAGEPK